jgi:hypothetical protein
MIQNLGKSKRLTQKKYGNMVPILLLVHLDLLCSVMDIPTPKDGEIVGNQVHNEYWEKQNMKGIKEYCEKDVDVLIQIIKKLKELR